MKRRKLITALEAALLIACLVMIAVCLLPGEEKPAWDETTTFHAELLSRDGLHFHVKGLPCNDVNGQGEFTFSISEDTPLLWHFTPATLDDLAPGAHVAVTYTGDVLETYPAQLTQVLQITLLDEEK